MNAVIDGTVDLMAYQILAFIGGFGWGDDHGAGVIQAIRLKTNIGDKILGFIEEGNLAIGICNGFQVLVNLGLLPGIEAGARKRSVALTYNDCGNFRDDWVYLTADADSPCVFTKGLTALELPIRHGEGKFIASADTLARLQDNRQIVLRYARPEGAPADGVFPYNPNGSVDDVAGICDPTGRIFGLMPHPEAYNHRTNHPDWTRKQAENRRKGIAEDDDLTPGIRMLQNGVRFMQGR